MAKRSEPQSTNEAPAPLGTDEEHDWDRFRTYLHALTPDSLWDAYIHVDEERFPRRREAIAREMQRRGLFFVSPYTEWEQKVRLLHINLLVFAFLAAAVHHIPTVTSLINRAALALNNDTPVLSPTGNVVSLVSGLSNREMSILNMLTYLFGTIATALLFIGLILLPCLIVRLRRRALHVDLLILTCVGLAAGGSLLALLCV